MCRISSIHSMFSLWSDIILHEGRGKRTVFPKKWSRDRTVILTPFSLSQFNSLSPEMLVQPQIYFSNIDVERALPHKESLPKPSDRQLPLLEGVSAGGLIPGDLYLEHVNRHVEWLPIHWGVFFFRIWRFRCSLWLPLKPTKTGPEPPKIDRAAH